MSQDSQHLDYDQVMRLASLSAHSRGRLTVRNAASKFERAMLGHLNVCSYKRCEFRAEVLALLLNLSSRGVTMEEIPDLSDVDRLVNGWFDAREQMNATTK